jgi:hypothetical protein
VQCVAPAAAEKVPALQTAGMALPVEHEEPAGQGVHPAWEVSFVLFENDPAAHGVAAGLPLAQKTPTPQGTGTNVPPEHT